MKMPTINTSTLTDLTAEEQAILAIVIKKDGTLRASKPTLGKKTKVRNPAEPANSYYSHSYVWATDEERTKARAAYVWRMVAFALSPHPEHQCMPTTASFDLDESGAESRAMEKKLDAFADRIVRCVPVRQQAGTMRWAQAYGLAGTPRYNEEGAVIYR